MRSSTPTTSWWRSRVTSSETTGCRSTWRAPMRAASSGCWCSNVPSQSRILPLGTAAPDFALPDPIQRRYCLDDFRDAQLLLVAFICNHCPYVQHMIDGLVGFARDYGARGVSV